MTSDKTAKIENNKALKKKIFSKNIWKNYAIIPPSLVMFAGISGIIYLLNLDKLISLYAIPFVLIFAIGTIWLKSTKRYLINKAIENSDLFLVCLSVPLISERKKTIILFSTGKNRNNRHFLEKEKKDFMATQKSDSILQNIDKEAIQLENTDLHLMSLPLTKKYSGKPDSEYYVIYTNSKHPYLITRSEIRKYLE